MSTVGVALESGPVYAGQPSLLLFCPKAALLVSRVARTALSLMCVGSWVDNAACQTEVRGQGGRRPHCSGLISFLVASLAFVHPLGARGNARAACDSAALLADAASARVLLFARSLPAYSAVFSLSDMLCDSQLSRNSLALELVLRGLEMHPPPQVREFTPQ